MNRKALFTFIVTLTALISGTSHAARVWMFHDVYIEEVIFGNAGGNTVIGVRLSDTSSPSSAHSCDPTASSRMVGFWDSTTNAYVQSLMSIALTAQAQGAPVDIMVETSRCFHGGTNWDNGPDEPVGLGLELRSIRVKTP